jgi:hypothetical protein
MGLWLVTCALHKVELCKLLQTSLLWLDDPIIHLLLEILWGKQAVKHMAYRIRHHIS